MNLIYSTISDVSFQESIHEAYKKPEALVINKTQSLFEIGKQKLSRVAKGMFPSLLSLGLGVATIPLNVIIHEWGHALAVISFIRLGTLAPSASALDKTKPIAAFASKFLDEDCNPIINWQGPLLMGSSVSSNCNLSGHSYTAVSLAGPLAEAIAILAVLRFSKSKYTPIVLLPHLAHLTIHPFYPFLGRGGDYRSIYEEGFIPYSIAVAVTLVPLALSIFSLKSSFFNSTCKAESDKNCKKD